MAMPHGRESGRCCSREALAPLGSTARLCDPPQQNSIRYAAVYSTMRFRFLLSVSVLVADVLPAHGQARVESLLQQGARVRYLLPHTSSSFTGVVEQTDSVGMVVRPDGLDASIRLGLDSLRALAVFGGRRSTANGAARGTGAGFLIGLGLGALITTGVWLSPADERCQDCWVSATAASAVVSLLGALVLGVFGGLLGSAAPGEIWHDIPLRR
jgi:hypothetical protein